MKQCAKCKEFKELIEFYKNIRSSDGHKSLCKKCSSDSCAVYYKANVSKVQAKHEIYRINHNKEINKNTRKWYDANKEQRKISMANYQKANPGVVNAITTKYQVSKLQRTPSWLTKEHFKQIEEFYIEAKELSWLCEGGLSVDHIVPLQGKNVSGLHVPWNLQIIPKCGPNGNSAKGNR